MGSPTTGLQFFALKGGTSLSKGYRIIDQFSENLDLLIEPPGDLEFGVNTTSQKPNAVTSRKNFYDWLAANIKIPGIERIERDQEFDDENYYRSGGIRLYYKNYTGSLVGVKDGVLLEAGFSQVAPNEPKHISSWTFEHAQTIEGIVLIDNQATNVRCYHPGYTFVEKVQTIIRHHRQEVADGIKRKNYMRQYYDLYCLLDTEVVQRFIDDPDYALHKARWIKGADAEISIQQNPTFLLEDPQMLEEFLERYTDTKALYYSGQVPFEQIVARIRENLHRL